MTAPTSLSGLRARLESLELLPPPPPAPDLTRVHAVFNICATLAISHVGAEPCEPIGAAWDRVCGLVDRGRGESDHIVALFGCGAAIAADPIVGHAAYEAVDWINATYGSSWWSSFVLGAGFDKILPRMLDSSAAWLHARAGCNRSRSVLRLPLRDVSDYQATAWPDVDSISLSAPLTRKNTKRYSEDELQFMIALLNYGMGQTEPGHGLFHVVV
jgi:hypothetical protein